MHFRNIVTESNEDRVSLKELEVQLHLDPENLTLQQLEKKNYLKFRKSSYLADIFLQQRSNARWIRLGDANTRYFHSVKHRQLKHAITQLQDNQGNWHKYHIIIARLFVQYYEELLGRKREDTIRASYDTFNDGPVRTIEQQIEILKPFNEEDVRKAMFSIDVNISPGPDGYGSGFYRETWDIVGQHVAEAVLEFFQNGKLLNHINATNISLIPKVSVPENASKYRPISCCNVIYKVISKLTCQK